jgi:hypothetical protein
MAATMAAKRRRKTLIGTALVAGVTLGGILVYGQFWGETPRR